MITTRRLLCSLTLAGTLLVSSTLQAGPPALDDPSKVMVIDGPITSQSIAPLKQVLLQELADGNVRPELQMILNSPGGSVFAGFQFISILKAAKAEGMRLVCIVPGMAASMAFQFLTICDERYVLNESMLLWHRARVGGVEGPITAPAAEHLSKQLQETDDSIMDQLVRVLPMNKKDITYHFEHESFHQGRALCSTTAPGFCTSYDVIPGLFAMINNPKALHSVAPLSIFDRIFRKGELIHIAPGFEQ